MKKQLQGKIVSVGMNGTTIVEVTRRITHPVYKKRLTRSKKYKVATNDRTVTMGETVTIEETRPVAKGKYFTLVKNKKEKK